MNPRQFKDLREGAAGFLGALALAVAIIVILLATFGFFDHGTTYKYPSEQRARR